MHLISKRIIYAIKFYLLQRFPPHFIPIDRICQIFEDVFGIAISPGTYSKVYEKLFRQLESFESSLKEKRALFT